jgi:hypothetical protein
VESTPLIAFRQPLMPFLDGLNPYKFLVKQEIVENFQGSGEEKRHVYPGTPREHVSDEQRADSGPGGSGHAGDSGSRGSLVRSHHRHDIGLPRGNIHLADTESQEKHQNREREIGHQWNKNEENVGRKMCEDHGVDQAPARSQTCCQKS